MAPVRKRLIDPRRQRTIPSEGFSWMDRRFVREGIAERLTGPELLLYFFLCSVSDADGLSFYGTRRICRTLKLRPSALEQAQRGLIREDLIRHDRPLYQVLSLSESFSRRPAPLRASESTPSLKQILEQLP